MKNILYLSKILFINSLGATSSKKTKTKSTSRIGIIFLVAFLAIIVAAPMVFMGYSLGIILNQYDMLTMAFKFVLPIASIMVIFFSIFSIISTFFLSNDTEILLGLPLKPYEIIIAKFINSLTSVYLIELMILTPILLGIGIGASCNILYYINILLVTIFLPIFPLSILGILITSVMRYSALSKMKDKMQYFVMIVAIIFAVGVQFVSQSASTSMTGNEENIGLILGETFNKSSNLLSSIMFFTFPASIALGSSNILISLGCIIGFICVSLLGLILFSFIGQKIYIKGILGKPQLKSRKRKEEKVELNEEKTTIFKNLVSNEWKMMWRSPSYNMNLISTVIIVPIICVISFFFGFVNSGEEVTVTQLMVIIRDSLNFDSASSMAFGIAVLSFFTCFSPIASTAISRDGKNAWFSKMVPIKPMDIIHAKMFWGIVLGFIPVLFIAVVGTIIGAFTILEIILIIIPLFLLVVLTNYIGIMIDLKRPKLNWDNENTAVKQNVNYLFFMLIDWAITALIAGLGVLFIFIKLPGFVTSLILTLIFGVSCVIIYKLLNKKGLAIFNKIG